MTTQTLRLSSTRLQTSSGEKLVMRRRSQLLLQLSLLLLLASSMTVQAQPTTPATGRLVFRVDASPPDEVFRGGIVNSAPSEGLLTNYDILDHTIGLICGPGQRSPWISTTRSGTQINEFLARQIRRETAITTDDDAALIEAWVYTVEADDSYLDVETVIRQAITAGRNNEDGYRPSHAQVLERLLGQINIHTRAEVLTRHIAPERVVSAQHVRVRPNRRAEWGLPQNNPNHQVFTPDGHRHLPELTQVVPPNSRAFSPVIVTVAANGTCYQTCDGARANNRIERSASQPQFDSCRGEPTPAQAFFGSED